MRVIQLKQDLKRIELPSKPEVQRHGALLPASIRAIIAGPSGVGKTDLLVTLLLHKNGLRYQNVYICAKTLYQDKYKLLQDVFSQIPEIGFYLYDNVDDIQMDAIKENSVFIFDDVATCHQNVIKDTYSFGRHKAIDAF